MRIKSITPAGKADVYNLEVDDTHDFVIQGGVVAHNCVDEARYFFMSRPLKAPIPVVDDPYYESPLSTVFDIPKDQITAKPIAHKMERLQ